MEATKLTLPVVKVASAIIFICGMVWFLSAKVTIQETQGSEIKQLQADMRSVPTRDEFNSLKESIDSIDRTVKSIQDYLLKK